MQAGTGEAMLQAHREMLMDGLRSVFGDFNSEMLQQVLPRLEWVEIGGGEELFVQGAQDQSLYFVLSGRLRASAVDAAGQRKTLGEIARGETVGEMAFFTGEARTATVTAIRDSVLARFSKEVFLELLIAYPLVSLNMTRLIIGRLKRASEGRTAVAKPVTIGITAITGQVDARDFAFRLHAVLSRFGNCTVVTSQSLDESLGEAGASGADVADSERSRRLALMLERIESSHQFVLFAADATPTGWTRRCLRHCDEILLVADADQPEALHPIEVECMGLGDAGRTRIGKTLVLLHPDGRRTPSNTRRWGAGRSIESHVHVRRNLASDWQRLGRIVSGNAVGLVLSGGGARGFAHLGVLRALEESGISYDMAAGTSIGAVMAAYAAMDLPMEEVIDRARRAFRTNPTGDYNLVPMMSLIGGKRLKSVIDNAVVDSRGEHIDIEDLWKSFFCVSSNYSTASEAVLTRGPLAKSIRASVSIPGALPPVMLDGELHIDGGTFNNFPTDVMSRMGAARIIGVNLLRDRNTRYELDEVPGPGALLRNRFRRNGRHKLPSMTSLLLNTSMMSSYARQKESQEFVDLYFAPEVHRYGMLEWSAFDRIVAAGYAYGQEQMSRADASLIPHLTHGEGPLDSRTPDWRTSTTRIMRAWAPFGAG